VNQYIHGGEGILKEIVQKIGFQIYKTEEMMQLIEYIREYNDDAEEEQLNFYGFDMQRIRYSFDALKKECIAEGVNLSFLDNFIIDGQWNQNYSYAEKKDLLMKLKKTLELKEFNGDLIHFVDVLLQNVEVLHRKDTDGSLLRDQYMAENVSWILQKEQQRGNDCIFIRGIMNMLQNGEVMTLWGNCYQINIDIM
jgi:erythromycin esterase